MEKNSLIKTCSLGLIKQKSCFSTFFSANSSGILAVFGGKIHAKSAFTFACENIIKNHNNDQEFADQKNNRNLKFA